MLRSKKAEFVTNLEELYKNFSSIIVTHYHGLTVAQLSILRRSLRNNGGGFKVVKNRLSKIAVGNVGAKSMIDMLSGPTAIAYSNDPVGVAKAIVDFIKLHESLKIVGGFVDSQLLNVEEVKQIAKLPSLDGIRGQIIGILQQPSIQLVTLLQAPSSAIARVLNAHANNNN